MLHYHSKDTTMLLQQHVGFIVINVLSCNYHLELRSPMLWLHVHFVRCVLKTIVVCAWMGVEMQAGDSWFIHYFQSDLVKINIWVISMQHQPCAGRRCILTCQKREMSESIYTDFSFATQCFHVLYVYCFNVICFLHLVIHLILYC